MDIKTLQVGQVVWLQSGDLRKEATVKEIAKHYMDVETVGEEGRRNLLRFRINGKPGTIFDNNRQWGCFRYIATFGCWWQEDFPAGTEFGLWNLVDNDAHT